MFCAEKTKRNIERITEITNEDSQSFNHFISDSPWCPQELMNKVSKNVNRDLGDPKLQALNIDESSTKKAGKSSVGVSRQYNGNEGKRENSQTGVFASLGRDNLVCLTQAKLFLPDEWIEDAQRCKKAGIPKNEIVKKSKVDIAIEIIRNLDEQGIEYGWVAGDSLYGNGYKFGKALEELGKKFVLDVRSNQYIYLEKPEIRVKKRRKIKEETKEKRFEVVNGVKPTRVDAYVQTIEKQEYTLVHWRKGTKGWLRAMFCRKEIWVWDESLEQPEKRILLIRHDENKKKYSLTNFTKETPIEELAFMQGQRYWIERSFQDNKNELGMTDYQVRKYLAWHHHMALVMMAMHFVIKKRIENEETIPLLVVRDIRLQLISILINGSVRIEKEIINMITRHTQRKKDSERYFKRKKTLLLI